MTEPQVDTDILIRLLTGDDPQKQTAARNLFRQVESGALVVAAPDTVVADAVYVLASKRLYGKPRHQVSAILAALVRLPGFHVANRAVVLRALSFYGSTNLDFGDAMIAASVQLSGGGTVYSYDRDFDRVPDVERVEP
jgi:predicted nucleic acid-binding protein